MTQPVLVPIEGILTVCGGKIEDPEKYPSAVFRGERVFFCAESCLKAFESDPERFMAGEINHPG
jgi:YHS domain-containing protein